jgi:hypothetical protein
MNPANRLRRSSLLATGVQNWPGGHFVLSMLSCAWLSGPGTRPDRRGSIPSPTPLRQMALPNGQNLHFSREIRPLMPITRIGGRGCPDQEVPDIRALLALRQFPPLAERVTDTKGSVALQSFTINVLAETPPVITSSPATSVSTVLPYLYQVNAQDAEHDPLTYSLTTFPPGMTINSSGLVSWTPPGDGSYPITVQVSDGRGGIATQSYTLVANELTKNKVPSITEIAQFPWKNGNENKKLSSFFPSTPAPTTLLLGPSSPSRIQTSCHLVNKALRKPLKTMGFEDGSYRACVNSRSPFSCNRLIRGPERDSNLVI